MRLRFVLLCLALCVSKQHLASEEILDLAKAIQLAMDASPELSAATAQVGMREGEKVQAGLYPNPELTVDLEDFGGSKFLKRFEEANITYVLSQDLELWGKRSARQAVAAQIQRASQWDYELAKINLRAKVAHAFIEASAIQEKEELAKERLGIMTDIVSTLKTKIASGKISAINVNREEVTLTRAQLAIRRLNQQQELAYKELSAFWGDDCPTFTAICYPFAEISSPGTLCDLLNQLEDHPELSRLEAEIQAACQTLIAEQREPLPDISVSGGVRQYLGHGAYGFVVELDIPLPVWNQNQGNISRARNQISFAISQKEAKQRELGKRLRSLHFELQSLYQDIVAVRDQILLSSQSSLAFIQAGYEAGKFDYLELLYAQRDYFDVREQYLDQLLLYHQKWIDLNLVLAVSPDEEC